MQLRTLLTLALCATPAFAQGDFDLEKRTPARLGAQLDLDVVGAPPFSLLMVIPSSTAGPTPLFLLDPTDLRTLSVGTDLLGAAAVVFASATGDASYSLGLPNNPSLSGFELNWQAIQVSLGVNFFGQLSNPVVTLTGAGNTGVIAPATLNAARAFSATLVDSNNNNSGGDVLITGGGVGTLTSATGLASTELWNFRSMKLTSGPNMSTARVLHSTVRLNDGRVLIIGGADQNANVLSSCEIYNPATNSFSSTGSMGTPRVLFGACLMDDGRVMVAGGTNALDSNVLNVVNGVLRSAEIYNPTTGSWSGTQNIGGYRLAPALTRLSNNRVLVSGGVQIGYFFGIPTSASSTTNCQRWTNGSWSSAAGMSQGRAGHQYNQVRLNDGRILMTGGVDVPSLLGATNAAPISGAEAYNPSSNSWQTVNMPVSRALHSATVLADGRVAVCGGAQGLLTAPVSIADVHLFNPATNSWSNAPALSGARASHTAALLPDGTLALFGGQGAVNTLNTVETLRF